MRSLLARSALAGAGVVALILCAPGYGLASTPIVPEVDGSLLATGLGVLGAGVLLIRARYGRK